MVNLNTRFIIEFQNKWWKDSSWKADNYIDRVIFHDVLYWLKNGKIVVIKGPRQTGKTTLFYQIISHLIQDNVNPKNIIYLSLDDETLRQTLSQNPKSILLLLEPFNEEKWLFLDEVQKAPGLIEIVKILNDTRSPVKIALSGSGVLEIKNIVSESLLGRTVDFVLYPFSFNEFLQKTNIPGFLSSLNVIKENLSTFMIFPSTNNFDNLQKSYKDFLVFSDILSTGYTNFLKFGGYPEISLNIQNPDNARFLLLSLWKTYLEKDIVNLLRIEKPSEYEKLAVSLTFNIGELVNFTDLGSDIGVSFQTIKKFMQILENTFIIKLLWSLAEKPRTSFKKQPKIFFIDHGLRNIIANIIEINPELKDTGYLIENLVFSTLLKWISYKERFYFLYFWRDYLQNEVDFIISKDNEILPIEVKYRHDMKMERSFRTFLKKYNVKKGMIISRNTLTTYKILEGEVFVIPINLFLLLI